MYEHLREARDVFNELIRMHELNMELLDTLTVLLKQVFDYAYQHNLPIENYDALEVLIKRASSLQGEITQEEFDPIRRKFTAPQNRRRVDSTGKNKIDKLVIFCAAELV